MTPFVVYYSKTGNTRKVATVIADALKTKARDVKETEPREIPRGAFLIVGSGVYGGKTGREMMDFVQSLPVVKGGKAATFETSGEGETPVAGDEMAGILRRRGYAVNGQFVCPGKLFYVLRRGRPTKEDLERAKAFAKGLSGK